MSQQNPICINCQIEYRPTTNGILCVARRADNSIDYLVWCDAWHCPQCDHRIVLKFGERLYTDTPESLVNVAEKYGRPVLDFWGNQRERETAMAIAAEGGVA